MEKESKWDGYFPIPNNRNRERLLDTMKDHYESRDHWDTNRNFHHMEYFKIIIDLLPEEYLHEAKFDMNPYEYTLELFKSTENDEGEIIPIKVLIAILPKEDYGKIIIFIERDTKFYRFREKEFTGKIGTNTAKDAARKLNRILKKHYGEIGS